MHFNFQLFKEFPFHGNIYYRYNVYVGTKKSNKQVTLKDESLYEIQYKYRSLLKYITRLLEQYIYSHPRIKMYNVVK